jgi:hypothetical protein
LATAGAQPLSSLGTRPRRAGWIQYPRELMANLLETEGIEAHAIWCALVSQAAYKPETFETAYGTVQLERGELLYSHRTFAARLRLRWTIVRTKVDKWANNGRITKRPLPRTSAAHTRAHRPTIITIVDFDTYSPPLGTDYTPEDTEGEGEESIAEEAKRDSR